MAQKTYFTADEVLQRGFVERIDFKEEMKTNSERAKYFVNKSNGIPLKIWVQDMTVSGIRSLKEQTYISKDADPKSIKITFSVLKDYQKSDKGIKSYMAILAVANAYEHYVRNVIKSKKSIFNGIKTEIYDKEKDKEITLKNPNLRIKFMPNSVILRDTVRPAKSMDRSLTLGDMKIMDTDVNNYHENMPSGSRVSGIIDMSKHNSSSVGFALTIQLMDVIVKKGESRRTAEASNIAIPIDMLNDLEVEETPSSNVDKKILDDKENFDDEIDRLNEDNDLN